MARSQKRTDDPPDSDRLNLGKPMNELIPRDPRYLPIAKLVLGLSFAGLIERLNKEGLSDRGTRLTLHNRLIQYDIQTVNPEEKVPWNPARDERSPEQPPMTPEALRLLQEWEEDDEKEEDDCNDGGEADAVRLSVAASTTGVTQSSTTTTTASTESTTTTMTSGCRGPIATPSPTPHMPHAGVMTAAEAFRQMCQGTPYASWENAMVPPPPMDGWAFPRLWPPAMPSPTLQSAQIHGIRDSGTETEAGARASPSKEDDARAQMAYTNTQRDWLYAFRYPQQSVPPTTVPGNPDTHYDHPQQHADDTHHGRPHNERREQVRTTLHMGGETPTGHHSSQPAARAPNASHPGNTHITAQSSPSPRHEWYSGSSSSDEWEPHTPTPQQPQARSRSSCSRKLEKESSRTLQVMKTLTSWKISFDGDPEVSREKAEEFLASIKECMEALDSRTPKF
ncbi:hypothetical protein QAD02_013585 [Eretmocerus hayati]|uniref:Uncharacterized protein n=1 Tax=Eretmocerus hayati TaxID=131215 RepID=A0ACC2P2V1_9HYME|nr:hypothetical protein QAD02_013585 [Eretmocerus hayati]